MILIVVPIVIIVFFATRYGVKSDSKKIRIVSYIGIFLSVATLVSLAIPLVAQRMEK